MAGHRATVVLVEGLANPSNRLAVLATTRASPNYLCLQGCRHELRSESLSEPSASEERFYETVCPNVETVVRQTRRTRPVLLTREGFWEACTCLESCSVHPVAPCSLRNQQLEVGLCIAHRLAFGTGVVSPQRAHACMCSVHPVAPCRRATSNWRLACALRIGWPSALVFPRSSEPCAHL